MFCCRSLIARKYSENLMFSSRLRWIFYVFLLSVPRMVGLLRIGFSLFLDVLQSTFEVALLLRKCAKIR